MIIDSGVFNKFNPLKMPTTFEELDVNADGKISEEDISAATDTKIKRNILKVINAVDADSEVSGDFDEKLAEERTYDLGYATVKVKNTTGKSSFDFTTSPSNSSPKRLNLRARDCSIEIVSVKVDDLEVTVSGNNITLNSTATVKKLINSANNSVINGSDGDDNIINKGRRTTVNAGKGNDTIKNFCGNGVIINGEDGDDTIYNSRRDVILNGGNGNDTITNKASNVTINGDDGNDTIDSYGFQNTINAGKGNNTIKNSSRIVGSYNRRRDINKHIAQVKATIIDANEGNNNIINTGYFVTIKDIEDNDTVEVVQPEDKKPCGKPAYFAALIDTILLRKQSV